MLLPEDLRSLDSDFFEIPDSIGSENKTENPRNPVMKFLALPEVCKILAFGTGLERFLCHAFFHRTISKHRPFAVAALTSFFLKRPAIAAHQTATGNLSR
jgi:hypothetical protein